MNPEDDRVLTDAARAIADALPVDWPAAESHAGADPAVTELLHQMRVVQKIAALHERLSAASGAESGTIRSNPVDRDPARTWGPLRLLEHIGRGAFGDVYRAWDPRLAREVALKLLHRREAADDSLGSAVIEEGRLLARVHHPNVVAVYGADQIDGCVGLWMELVRGRTLETMLRDDGPFEAERAAQIGVDLCRALAAVHHAGMLHLDVKAQNVICDPSGRTVLMDFGAGREDLVGQTAGVAGTPLYVAPEMLNGGTATARSDLYSVGVLLYHLVTGGYPVHGRDLAEVRAAHASRRRSPVGTARAGLSVEFRAVVDRALESEPAARFDSAGAMAEALAQATQPAPAAARRQFRPAGRATGSWGWAHAVLASAVALLAMVPLRMDASARRGPSAPGGLAMRERGMALHARRVELPGVVFGRPSPDGTLHSMTDDSGNIVVVDLKSGQVHKVTSDGVFQRVGSQYAIDSAISPDNGFVAYSWLSLDGRWELRTTPSAGGAVRVLLRCDPGDYPHVMEWSRDGREVLAVLRRLQLPNQMTLVSADGAGVRVLADLGSAVPSHAGLSPDGSYVVYDVAENPGVRSRDLFIVATDGSPARRLLATPTDDANPVWSPDGERVAFTRDRGTTADLWTVAVAGGRALRTPELVRRDIGRIWLFGVTQSGDYFYGQVVSPVEVYEADLTPAGIGRPRTIAATHPGVNISSVWASDGWRVAYASRRAPTPTGNFQTLLVIHDLQTGEETEIVPSMRSFLLKSWSPDARRMILGGLDLDARSGPRVLDVATGGVTPLGTESIRRPDWLADGRVVYLAREQRRVIARNLNTGEETLLFDLQHEPGELVADAMGRGFGVSPDGQTLAFTVGLGEGPEQMCLLKTLRAGVSREVARVKGTALRFQSWTADSAAMLFTEWEPKESGPIALWRASVDGGAAQPLGFSTVGLRDLSVSPDGSRITFTAGWPVTDTFAIDSLLGAK